MNASKKSTKKSAKHVDPAKKLAREILGKDKSKNGNVDVNAAAHIAASLEQLRNAEEKVTTPQPQVSSVAEVKEVVEEAETVAIVSTGQDTTKKEKFELFSLDQQPTSLADMFDRFMTKLYLIDVSVSMTSGMAPEDEVLQYKWTPEVLAKFREYIHDQQVAEICADDPSLSKEEAEEEYAERCMGDLISDDEALKRYIVDNKLDHTAKIDLDHNYNLSTESKIQAVRGAMKNFADSRFKKYPDAHFGVMVFDNRTAVKCYSGSPSDQVLNAIETLSTHDAPGSGGTDIFQAVERALGEFKRRPSQVGAHHLILVTDGEDFGAIGVENLLPKMKELNVVFDFIYVKGQRERSYGSSSYNKVAETLKKVCSETGGEYQEVSKSSDFKVKFLQASSRRALPPARD